MTLKCWGQSLLVFIQMKATDEVFDFYFLDFPFTTEAFWPSKILELMFGPQVGIILC
jgi:hypothetical protein